MKTDLTEKGMKTIDSWHSYPSVFALGHKAVSDLFKNSVLIEEKIDGSQFSFGRFGGEMKFRSKNKEIYVEAPEKMFTKAVEVVQTLDLTDGWTYRAEYLQKPKHNCVVYDRIPDKYLILFDINIGNEDYLSYQDKQKEAERVGLEVVPLIYEGIVSNSSLICEFLKRDSILGKTEIEGVVIKNYQQFGKDKKVLMGKYVSEKYKEINRKTWGSQKKDIKTELILMFKTDVRWEKAVQHLKEEDELENSPRDIGKLIIEVKEDIKKECVEEIKDILFKWAINSILRGSVGGLPEWYKKRLLESQFEGE